MPGCHSSGNRPSKLGVHEFLPSLAELSCFPGTRSSTQAKICVESCSLLVVFLPDHWFQSHLSHQLFCSTSNKQSSARNSCINDSFFLHLKSRLPALKCIPCCQKKRGNVLHTLTSPICLCFVNSEHVQIASQKYRILQDCLVYHFECRQTARDRYLPDLVSESS